MSVKVGMKKVNSSDILELGRHLLSQIFVLLIVIKNLPTSAFPLKFSYQTGFLSILMMHLKYIEFLVWLVFAGLSIVRL